MLFSCVLIIIVFAVSAILTRAMMAYAMRRCLVDVPNERSSHAAPTPRGGGLAIVVAFLAGLVLLHVRGNLSLSEFAALAGSAAFAAAVGFWDDHRQVSARHRVLVHFFAAAWALYWLGGFPSLVTGLSVAHVAENIFWLVALVWFLNTFNFMDGIDGIAGAEAVCISGAAGLILVLSGSPALAVVAFLLATAVAGFLVWNIPPARIFMGDVGSGFLGLVLGVLAIVSVRAGAVNMWVWTILFGVFIVDATVTVARRIAGGKRWHCAHCSHAYQHAARECTSHGKVTLAVTMINVLWLFPWAFAAYRWRNFGPLFAMVAYVPLVFLAFRFRAGRETATRDPESGTGDLETGTRDSATPAESRTQKLRIKETADGVMKY